MRIVPDSWSSVCSWKRPPPMMGAKSSLSAISALRNRPRAPEPVPQQHYVMKQLIIYTIQIHKLKFSFIYFMIEIRKTLTVGCVEGVVLAGVVGVWREGLEWRDVWRGEGPHGARGEAPEPGERAESAERAVRGVRPERPERAAQRQRGVRDARRRHHHRRRRRLTQRFSLYWCSAHKYKQHYRLSKTN